MKPSISPRFQAATCAAITVRISVAGSPAPKVAENGRTLNNKSKRTEKRAAKLLLICNSYNLDLRPPTYYIKRVLRPLCFVALSLAALTPAFGQPKPTSAPGV